MTAVVLPFSSHRRTSPPRPWRPSEIAEIYRVIDLLGRAGIGVSLEAGFSDEGDPWLIVLRDDTEEVIVHIARIDDLVVAANVTNNTVFRGPTLADAMRSVLSTQSLLLPSDSPRLLMHPATILAAFIATALIQSGSTGTDVEASAPGEALPAMGALPIGLHDLRTPVPTTGSEGFHGHRSAEVGPYHPTFVAAAVATIATVISLTSDTLLPPHGDLLPAAPTAQRDARLAHGEWHGTAPDLGKEPEGFLSAPSRHSEDAQIADVEGRAGQFPGARYSAQSSETSPVPHSSVTSPADRADTKRDDILTTPELAMLTQVAAEVGPAIPSGHPHQPIFPGISPMKFDNFGLDSAGEAYGYTDRLLRAAPAVTEKGSVEGIPTITTVPKDNLPALVAWTDTNASSTASHPHQALDLVSFADGQLLYWWGASLLGFADVSAATSAQGDLQAAPTAPLSVKPADANGGVPSPPLAENASLPSQARMPAAPGEGEERSFVLSQTTSPEAKARILAEFAHDPAAEFSAPAGAVEAVREAIAANPFLPHVDRVILFEASELKADLFMLMPDVAMLRSDKVASDMLHSMSAQQLQFMLADGASLRLLGVIDI